MIKTTILQKDQPVLRQKAKPVVIKDVSSPEIRKILSKMKDALHGEDDGVAIAAPQIGESLRIFIVKGEALAMAGTPTEGKELKDLVFINPEITKISKKKRTMEEGCLSVRYLYGKVERSEKITIRAFDEFGVKVERGASGLLAQIFQHEIDHLDGILFIDKAEDLQDLPPPAKDVKFVFFGSSRFSNIVLGELERMKYKPLLTITSAKEPLPLEKLKELEADVFVVASFGKILSKEVLNMPKYGSLNVHPSLLPKLRGPSPIQGSILTLEDPGVTIIKMDEKMDHGPVVAKQKFKITPWPDHYDSIEEKLGIAGGRMLGVVLPKWIAGEIEAVPQDEKKATFTKLIQKEDGLLDLTLGPEENLRKVLAYSTWPGAYMMYQKKNGKEVRLVVKEAEIIDDKFTPTRVIPAGKKEMNWQDFLRGN